MSGDYTSYDLRDDDPYLLPNSSCLVNLLGITDTATLNQAESDLTQITLADLVRDPVVGQFDLSHLQQIHKRIFLDIYPFAGETRKVDIMKGGKLFLPHALIKEKATIVFSELHAENNLIGYSLDRFSERAGYYLGVINKIHAFREGNGRTQRVFIDQLASQNNYHIEWQAISGEAMAKACRNAREIPELYQDLQRLIRLNIKLF